MLFSVPLRLSMNDVSSTTLTHLEWYFSIEHLIFSFFPRTQPQSDPHSLLFFFFEGRTPWMSEQAVFIILTDGGRSTTPSVQRLLAQHLLVCSLFLSLFLLYQLVLKISFYSLQ